MYRILRPLEIAGEIVTRGSLRELKELSKDKLDRLLLLGLIAKVAAPPLKVLPGWTTRAAKLESFNINDADQFLTADDAILADALRTNAARIAAWKTEVRSYLTAKPERR